MISAAQFHELRGREPDLVGHVLEDGTCKVAAGWLIDRCGWKGHRQGAVGVHDRQALVLVHDGTGTAGDLLQLAQRIRDDVQARFGIALEIEPRVY